MSRQSDDNPRWVLVEEDVVARVEGTFPNGRVTGLMVYGDITSERLRSVNVGRLDSITERAGVWYNLPTREQVQTRYRERLSLSRIVTDANGAHYSRETWPLDDVEGYVREFATRLAGESEDAFLYRFALAMQAITPIVDSAHKTMAHALGYSPNTVKSYVLKCRKLGYLPPTRRSTR